MDPLFSSCLSAIDTISWQEIDAFPFPSPAVREWLLTPGSLTERLQDNCSELRVELFANQWCEGAGLKDQDHRLLNAPERYLLRQVLLLGDAQPWLIGHSLIPQATAQDPGANLAELGNKPLGHALFRARSVGRDSLQVARVTIGADSLYARRSRLWVNDQPMLVTELFLPAAPIYR